MARPNAVAALSRYPAGLETDPLTSKEGCQFLYVGLYLHFTTFAFKRQNLRTAISGTLALQSVSLLALNSCWVQHYVPLTNCKQPLQHWPVKKPKGVHNGGSCRVGCVTWPASIHDIIKLPAVPISQGHENEFCCVTARGKLQLLGLQLLVCFITKTSHLFSPSLPFRTAIKTLFPMWLDDTSCQPVLAWPSL